MDDKTLDLQLSKTIEWALKEKANQIALGATREEAEANFEKTVRAAWPRSRQEPWHFLCDRCNDTGYFQWRCVRGHRCDGWSTTQPSPYIKGPARWRRRFCADEANRYEHDVVEFCKCSKGEGLRKTYDQSNRPRQSDDFAQAGKTKKSSPTRMWGGGE